MINSEESSWRFTMELLSHVHTLRVFLIQSSPHVQPDRDCLNLAVSLLSAPPVLSCTWTSARDASSCLALYLPLPLLLFDYSVSPRLSTLPDCIQLSLSLLPLLHSQLHASSYFSIADYRSRGSKHNDSFAVCHNPIDVDDACRVYQHANNLFEHDGFSNDATRAENASISGNEIGKVCQHATADTFHVDVGICGNTIQGVCQDAIEAHNSEHAQSRHGICKVVNANTIACSHDHEGVGHDAIHAICGHDCQNDHGVGHNSIHAYGIDRDDGNDSTHHEYDSSCTQQTGFPTPDYGKEGHSQEGALLHPDARDDSNMHPNFGAPSLSQGVPMEPVHEAQFIHIVHPHCDKDETSSNPDMNGKANTTLLPQYGAKSLQSGFSVCIQHGQDKLLHNGVHFPLHHHEFCSSLQRQHDENGTCYSDCGASLDSQGYRIRLRIKNDGSSMQPGYQNPANIVPLPNQSSKDHLPTQEVANLFCRRCLAKVSKNPVRSFVELPCVNWRDIVENWFGACCCSFGSKAEVLSANFEKTLHLRPGKCLVGFSTFYMDFLDIDVDTRDILPSANSAYNQLSTLSFLALGNGFMVWENEHSKSVNWFPVYCTSCTSLIGAYPCKTSSSGSIREGLHLFRCQITTFKVDGSLYEAYRYTAFKELLAKELRLKTEEDTSYRFLIRSLQTKSPLLQIVVLDYDSMICTGRVTASVRTADGDDLETNSQTLNRRIGLLNGFVEDFSLRRSIKLMFSDCSRHPADDLRSIQGWVEQHDAETIYMLEEFVDKLKSELLTNSLFCPAASGWSSSLHGSFLYASEV